MAGSRRGGRPVISPSRATRRWLTPAEEVEFHAAARAGNVAAQERMVGAVYAGVYKSAKRLAKGRTAFDDLVQEGSLGAMRAIKTFDPRKGRWHVYAWNWIREHQARFRGKTRTVVSGTEIHNDSRQSDAERAAISEQSLTTAASFGILTYERIKEEAALSWVPHALVQHETPETEFELKERREILHIIIEAAGLTPRERAVIEARYLSHREPTLKEVGAPQDLTRERIRQIENIALQKLRAAAKDLFEEEMVR